MRYRSVIRFALLVGALCAPAMAAAQPTTRPVDCSAGQRIQAAVDVAHAGDVILVRGFCSEHVRILDEAVRVTLDGQGVATIHGPTAGMNTVLVAGRNITLKGFTIIGGRNGVAVLRGGTALIDTNVIRESAENGINVAQHSYARIVNNRIQLHPAAGIRVLENSFARIGFLDLENPVSRGNVIADNGPWGGVLVQRSAGASLVGNNISGNQGPGVSIVAASQADLAGNQIDGNGADGVVVTQHSFVQLGDGVGIFGPPNDTGTPNAGYGLSCSLNSAADGQLGTLTGAAGQRRFDSTCANGPKIK